MKKNYSKLNIVISACVILFLCGFDLFLLSKIVTKNFDAMGSFALVFLLSLYLFAMAWTGLLIETRTCKITKSGISVKYLLSNEKLIPWEQFHQVCHCYEPIKKWFIPPKFTDREIICFVLKKAKKNYWGYWNVFSIRYFRKILFVRYSEEVMKELQGNCPLDILDLRNEKIYQNK